MNPLLTKHKYMPFGKFTIADLDDALTKYLKLCLASIKKLERFAAPPSWDDINQFLHLPLYKFNQIWSLVDHLLAVNDNNELRELQAKFQPLITDFYVNLGQNEKIYQQYKWLKDNGLQSIDDEAKKVIENEFREFFLNGISLDITRKQELKQIKNQLNELYTKFEQNLLDATDAFKKYVSLEELAGVPSDILQLFAAQADDDNNHGLYKLSLHMPSYLPVMQYCENRKLREKLYYQYTTRASELSSDPGLNNTDIIYQILNLRQQKAKLLGFKSYAELSLHTKMADDSEQILKFLYQLAEKSKKTAKKDIKELALLASQFGIDKLEAWDIPFFSEKLQQQKYSYSQHELKQYFQLPMVLKGLFKLIKNLYQVEFVPTSKIPLWHEQMQTFKVKRNRDTIGYLYLDLFARTGKQSGAWMNSAQDKFNYKNYSFRPMAYVLCNFTPPMNNEPSLLTFDEVQTIFHEMGHALHHLLTTVNHYAISGINGVEWDAVELPSQFMEYFTWNYPVLSSITKHVQTGNVLPLELYNKLLNGRFYQSSLHMLRQLEFSIFDLLLHQDLVGNFNYLKILNEIRKDIAVTSTPKFNRFPNSFSHIFSGGYASGYYSYKWAEVLATDIFATFDQAGTDKYPELGQKFLTNILSQGGLNPMLKNFEAFMGRMPQIDALLKYSGIK